MELLGLGEDTVVKVVVVGVDKLSELEDVLLDKLVLADDDDEVLACRVEEVLLETLDDTD